MNPRLYFAYGSNLNQAQMHDRCPAHRLIGLAELPGHRFLIGARGYATIKATPGECVLGALYSLTPEDEAALDRYEGVQGGSYEKHLLTVEDPQGRPAEALVYIDPRPDPGAPAPGYLAKILDGAAELGLPAEYRDFLGSFGREGQ